MPGARLRITEESRAGQDDFREHVFCSTAQGLQPRVDWPTVGEETKELHQSSKFITRNPQGEWIVLSKNTSLVTSSLSYIDP